MTSVGLSYQSPVRPARILVSGSLVTYQVKFKLEAVGIDVDPAATDLAQSIKPLGQMTYRPTDGWGAPDTIELILRRELSADGVADKRINEVVDLALQSVYRYYRITGLAEGGWDVGQDGHGATKLDEVLPLLPTLVDTVTDQDGIKTPARAFVTGTYLTGSMDDAVADVDSPLGIPFSFMPNKGIIVFSKPVTLDVGGDQIPDLRLTCSVNLVDSTGSRVVTRRESSAFEREDSNAFGVHTIKKPELLETRIHRYDEDTVTTVDRNDPDVDTEADKYILEGKAQFQSEIGGAISYRGLVPVEMSGGIRQVTYSIGPGGTTTTASYNGIHDRDATSPAKKKELNRVERLQRRVDNLTRAKDLYQKHLNWLNFLD